MSSIQILSPQLANQIAAGEVVERPASVLKELVENSLDAGAQSIEIDIEQGGVKLIRIRDDGGGIAQIELALALSRHATSKIDDLEDLEAVATLGFRGEALASIASVSRLSLTSNNGAAVRWKAMSEGRDMQVEVTASLHPQGTSVEVRDLFFNTPARRKFLRTEKTEYNRIDDSIKKLALSRFDVAFNLRHNQRAQISCGRPRLSWSRKSALPISAAAPLWSRRCMWTMTARLRLWGWIGLPTFSTQSGGSCSTFLSMVAVFATKWFPMPCVRPIRMCSIMAAIRPLFCFLRLHRRMWMSMCIPPSTRCAFARAVQFTALSQAP